MRGMSCRNHYFLNYIILSMQTLVVSHIGYIIIILSDNTRNVIYMARHCKMRTYWYFDNYKNIETQCDYIKHGNILCHKHINA